MGRTLISAAIALSLLVGYQLSELPIDQERIETEVASPDGRAEYEHARLVNPATGQIPKNIRMRELAFASSLGMNNASRGGELEMEFTQIGPYNVGGRTRAFAIDRTDTDTYFAGGVSGGVWKSTDAGASWNRVTASEDHAAVSCISQDPRSGKSNIWYYGSGEVSGNSASKSFSAYYRGSGIYKSTDNGDTWTLLDETATLIHKASDWDAVFRVLVDPVRADSDVVVAAMSEGIMRSNDGGETWKTSLFANDARFTDVQVTTSGTYYAAIGSDGGANRGFWRSTDGLNWTDITPSGLPNTHGRTLMAIYPGDQTRVYFFSVTPGAGNEGNSLWKYRYLSGDGTGTGAIWSDRSAGLPDRQESRYRLNLNNGYCQALGVKPDDEDMVYVGGTNLFRSSDGFQDTLNTDHIGGYRIQWDTNFTYRSGVHYPDQQTITFDPNDPDLMISTSDGGLHRTYNCGDSGFVWESMSNGYVVSQFYGIAIDHGTPGSEEVMGGLQDRGTFWTNDTDPSEPWTSVRGADGAYCWIEDGGGHQYSSTQYANVRRASINAQGELDDWIKVMPEELNNAGGFLFVHPFTLDPVDNDIMYLPYQGQIWRNDDLPAADDEDLTSWRHISTSTGLITTIAASEAEQGVVYYGTSQGTIFRLDDAHNSGTQTPQLVSTGITSGSYASCISIDPYDADRVIVAFSNYSVISLWLTEDGGDNWEAIEGNLKGNPDVGVPPSLYYLSDGPSIRWAEMAMTDSGYVYFIGTSVGLFSTRELDGDSTEWKMEGVNTIGNVVVDMLDYREEDQWLVVGTHGNGIYTANVSFAPEDNDTIQGIGEFSKADHVDVSLYPNPTTDILSISLDLPLNGNVTVLDQLGRPLDRMKLTNGRGDYNTSRLSAGQYYIKVETEIDVAVSSFIKTN
jgi:hypothetical protein